MSSTTTNRTMTSTVDSYAKVPPYDICLSLNHHQQNLNQIEQESTSSASLLHSNCSSNSSPNSTTKLTAGSSEAAQTTTSGTVDYLKTFFQIANGNNKQQLQNFYETICAREYQMSKQANLWHNYAEYNPIAIPTQNMSHNNNQQQPKFDSYVVLPNGQLLQSSMLPANSTVVLIKPTVLPQHTEEQQYSTVVYGDLVPTSSNSTTLNSEQQQTSSAHSTLITFNNASNSGSEQTSSDKN